MARGRIFEKISLLVGFASSKFLASPSFTINFPITPKTIMLDQKEEPTPIVCEELAAMNKIVEERLTDFMSSLQTKIVDMSTTYRLNIQRRMDLFASKDAAALTEMSLLTQQGEKMKKDLEKFRDLALNSGYMAYHQAISSMHAGSINPKKIVCGVYCEFEKTFSQQFTLNEEYESRLAAKELTHKKPVSIEKTQKHTKTVAKK